MRAVPIPYICTIENNFLPDPKDIEKLITNRSKCIILCNPGNPTGASFDRERVEQIVSIAKRYGIFLISDGKYNQNIKYRSRLHSADKKLSPPYYQKYTVT